MAKFMEQISTRKRRPGNPKWVKGVSGNPKGPPGRPEIAELRKALKDVAKIEHKTFIRHFVELSYRDNQIAIALAKKILPDLIAAELDILRELPPEEVVRRILETVDKRNGGDAGTGGKQ